MGAEDIGIVIQKNLLHPHRQLSPPSASGSGHLLRQRLQRVAVVSVIAAGTVQAVVGKEIFRVPGGRGNHGADIDIPGAAVRPNPIVIRRVVDHHVKPILPSVAWAASASRGCS